METNVFDLIEEANGNTSISALDRYNYSQNKDINPDIVTIGHEVNQDLSKNFKNIIDSSPSGYDIGTKLQEADIVSSVYGIPFKNAYSLVKNSDVVSTNAPDRITEKPNAYNAMIYNAKNAYYSSRAGEAFSKYVATGDEEYKNKSFEYLEKSKQFKVGQDDWNIAGNLLAGAGSAFGSSITADVGATAIRLTTSAGALFFPWLAPAGLWASRAYGFYKAGSSQAGLQALELSLEKDEDGNNIDITDPKVKALLGVNFFAQGLIEMVGLELNPGYKKMVSALGRKTVADITKSTFKSVGTQFVKNTGLSIFDESGEEFMGSYAGDIVDNLIKAYANKNGGKFEQKEFEQMTKDAFNAFGQTAKEMVLFSMFTTGLGTTMNETSMRIQANKNQSGDADNVIHRGIINQALPKEVTKPEPVIKTAKTEEKTEEPIDNSDLLNTDGKLQTVNVIKTENGGIPATEKDARIIAELDKKNKGYNYGVRANIIGQNKSKMQADQITSIGYAVNAKADKQGNLAFDNQEDFDIAKRYVEENLFITNRKEEDGQINYTAIDEAGSRVEFSFRMAEEGEQLSSISGITDKMPSAPSVLASDEKFFADAEKKLVSDYILSKNPKMSGDTLKSSTNALITLFNTLDLNTDEALEKNFDLVLSDAPAEHLGAKGWFKREETSFNPDGSKKFTIHITKNADPTTLVHESWHLLSYALGPETMNAFANAYNGKIGEMWVSDIKKTPEGKYQLGSKTFDTYSEAFEQVRGFEERLAEDAEKFFKNGVAPTEETRNIFQKLLDFIRKLVSQHSEELSAETVKAFRQVLGQARPTTEAGIAGEALYQEDKSFTETESMLKADPERFNEKGEHLAPNGKKSNLDYNLWVRVHTPEFKNWFGDWENDPQNASKVVDENGEPLVVYHGTDEKFEEFLHKYIGKNGTSLGQGFYFTPIKNIAEGYSSKGNVMETFLNIRNPLRMDLKGFNNKELKSIINKMIDFEIEQYPDEIEDYKDSFISNYVDTYSMNRTQAIKEVASLLYEQKDTASNNMGELSNVFGDNGIAVSNAVISEIGYDGFIEDNFLEQDEPVYVAWKSNQIKSVENVGAFSPDTANILYQEENNPYPNDPTYLKVVKSEAFKNWFGDWENDPANASKVVDKNGFPLKVYHNTTEEFTTFKEGEKAGLSGKGIYFSEYPLRQFGGVQIEAYLNIRNPITRETEKEGMREINSAGIPTRIIPDVFEKFPEFDGVINRQEIVVKSPNQIKSVDNIGTFLPEEANILFQEDKAPLYQLSEKYKAKISQDTSEQVRKVLEAKTSFVPDFLLEKHIDKPWAREEIKFRRQAKMLTPKEEEFILSFDSLEEYIEKARASQELEVTDPKLIEQDNKNLERLYTYFQLKNKTPEKLDSDFSEKIRAMSDAELIEFGKNLNRGVIGKSRTGGKKGIIKTGATAVSLAGVSPRVLRLSETSTAEEITTARKLILENPKYYRWAEQKLSEAEKKATGEVLEQEILLDREAREDFYREIAEKKESLAEKIKAEKINKEFRQATLDELESKLLDDIELLEKGELKDEDISSIKSDIAVAEEKISQAKKEIEKLNSQIKTLKKNEKANEQIIRDLEEAVSQYKAVLAQSGAEKLDLQTKLEETTKKYKALERSKKIREAREARETLIKKIKNRSVLNNLTLDASYAPHLDFIHSLFNKKDRSEVNQEISELIQDQKTAKLFGNKYKVGKIQEELNSLRALRDSSDIIEIPDELKPFFSDELKSKITAIKKDNRQSKWTIDELTQILNVLENVRDTAKNSLLKKKAERTEILNASMTNFVKQHANNNLDPKSEENIKALNKFVDYTFADYDNRPKNVIRKAKDVVGSLYRGYAAQGVGVSRWLDGWQEGVLFDYMNRKALRNENAQLKNSHARWQVLDNYLKEHGYGHKNLHKNFITYSFPKGDTTINLGEAIGVYCFSKNGEEAMIKLKSQAGNQMSEGTINEIIEKLSDEDKALGDFLIETIGGDEIWNRLSEKYLKVYNRNLGRRQNYMTFVPKNTIGKSEDNFATDFLVNANGTPVKYTEKGMTKQINPQAVYRLDLDVVNIVYSQIKRQEHFLAWCEWSRDMNYMLNSTMGRTIRRIYGTDALQTLQNLVNQYVAPNEVLVKWEKNLNTLLSNVAVADLGFNPVSAAKQFASLSAVIRGDITLKGLTETVAYVSAHPAKTIRFVNEKSPFMKDRTFAIAVSEYKKYAERGQLSTFAGQVNEKYAMKMIEFNDNIVASIVWLARYKTAIEKEGASVEEAIFQADMTVRETQSSSNVLDRSKAQASKNPFTKMVLLFTNDAFKMANQISFGLPYYIKQKNWKKFAGTFISILTQATIVTLIAGAFFKRKGDDDENKERKNRIILALLGQLADDLIPVAGRIIEGGLSGFYSSGSQVAEPFQDVGELVRKLVKSEGTEEDVESINKTLINTVFDVGTVSALPVVQSKRAIKAITNKNAWELLGPTYADIFSDEDEWDF